MTRRTISPHQRLHNLVEEFELADQVELDVYGLGEHHRPDFASSAPAVVLAAAAARAIRIRLTSAVTILSSDDPVRVFQPFSTLDLPADGQTEIRAGRGSFIESFPVSGFALDDYDEMFAGKLDPLLKLRGEDRVTWFGKHRPALSDQPVYPRPYQERLPVSLAIGGTPASAIRGGCLGLPLAVAIIGGVTKNMVPLVQRHREAARRSGHDPARLSVTINSHGYAADSMDEAIEDSFLPHKATKKWCRMTWCRDRSSCSARKSPHPCERKSRDGRTSNARLKFQPLTRVCSRVQGLGGNAWRTQA